MTGTWQAQTTQENSIREKAKPKEAQNEAKEKANQTKHTKQNTQVKTQKQHQHAPIPVRGLVTWIACPGETPGGTTTFSRVCVTRVLPPRPAAGPVGGAGGGPAAEVGFVGRSGGWYDSPSANPPLRLVACRARHWPRLDARMLSVPSLAPPTFISSYI
jgi:hypothetical protein